MPYALPDPTSPYPVQFSDGTVHKGTVHLSEAVKDHPRFSAGAFSYASDLDPPETLTGWTARLAPYLFDFSQDSLSLGRFCQIAQGVRFITASANHAMDGLTTFPFPVFDTAARIGYQPDTRDTRIGHDVWIGYGATILPGARIGHGVIIGARTVVRGTVPDYAIVTGNPGRVTRFRFAEAEIAMLLDLAWWDWPVETIQAAQAALLTGDLEALRRAGPD